MPEIRILDVVDPATFALVPLCADASFDHRTCDYWEDGDRGSKANRPGWLAGADRSRTGGGGPGAGRARDARGESANPFAPTGPAMASGNPFAPDPDGAEVANPFAPATAARPPANPFLEDRIDPLADNPFAPSPRSGSAPTGAGPRKLTLLGRGLAVFGSYAKVLLVDEEQAAYAQFGPLSAYPRALRIRELYPQLPEAPLPAVITCIATTSGTRGRGLGLRLVEAVCEDLAARGFAAVEAYPATGEDPEATSAATPDFWRQVGFATAVDDLRYPVMRRVL